MSSSCRPGVEEEVGQAAGDRLPRREHRDRIEENELINRIREPRRPLAASSATRASRRRPARCSTTGTIPNARAAALLLPDRSARDGDLPRRGGGEEQRRVDRERAPRRERRRQPGPVPRRPQDGDGHGQDRGDGDAHRLAHAEQGRQPAGRAGSATRSSWSAPGITIRDRLRVLLPSDPSNYYRELDLVPPELLDDLGRAKVVITNFHAFKPKEKLSRRRRRPRQVLGPRARPRACSPRRPTRWCAGCCRDLGTKRNIVVLNDEAHHCYRRSRPTERPTRRRRRRALKGEEKRRGEAARRGGAGLAERSRGRSQRKVGIRAIYDLSATPFFLEGSGWPEGTLFPWVVSRLLADRRDRGRPREDPAGAGRRRRRVRRTCRRTATSGFTSATSCPSKGRKDADRRRHGAAAAGGAPGALHSLYGNYEKAFARWHAHAELGDADDEHAAGVHRGVQQHDRLEARLRLRRRLGEAASQTATGGRCPARSPCSPTSATASWRRPRQHDPHRLHPARVGRGA